MYVVWGISLPKADQRFDGRQSFPLVCGSGVPETPGLHSEHTQPHASLELTRPPHQLFCLRRANTPSWTFAAPLPGLCEFFQILELERSHACALNEPYSIAPNIQSRNFTVDVAPQGHLLPPHNNLRLPHYGTSGIAMGTEIPNGDRTTWLSVAEHHMPRQNLTPSQPYTLKPCFTPC